MKTFNIGIIGSGRIARIHCLALKLLPNVSVQGVTSHTLSNAEKFAQKLNIPKVYRSIEEMCSDQEIDAVHVCNINTAHYEALHQVISAGKAVLCEKPLCVSTEEIETLLHMHPKNMMNVCFPYRFHFTTQKLRQYIQQHGAPSTLRINYHQSSWLKKQPWQPQQEVQGKSYLMSDIGVHALDLASFLLCEKLTLKNAKILFSGKKYECSDVAAELDLLSENKTEIHISTTKMSTEHDNHFSVQAIYRDHTITIPDIMHETVLIEKNSKKEILRKTADLDTIDILGFPSGHLEGWLSSFINLFSLFYQQLQTGQPNPLLPTVQESLAIQQLIDKIFETGDWQAL